MVSKHFPGIVYQKRQHLIFDRGQMHLAASDKDFSLLEIHLEGIQLEDRLLLGDAAAVAQCDPDSGKKFTGVKRLGDIIVGSGVQRAYLLLLHVPQAAEQLAAHIATEKEEHL